MQEACFDFCEVRVVYGPYMDVPCGLSALGEGGKEADEDCPSGRS